MMNKEIDFTKPQLVCEDILVEVRNNPDGEWCQRYLLSVMGDGSVVCWSARVGIEFSDFIGGPRTGKYWDFNTAKTSVWNEVRNIPEEVSDTEREYDIWREGFCATGQSSLADFVTTVKAKSFKEACEKYFAYDDYFDPSRMTYWGCRLFDNETDARKSFG